MPPSSSPLDPGLPVPQAQTVQEVFVRQLMQVRGVSGEKAAALAERYSTPARYSAGPLAF